MAKIYVSPKLSLGHVGNAFGRADIEVHGLQHDGPSFEARVFVDRPDATAATPRAAAEGYVGSFHVFGHGGCWGAPGHCTVKPRRAYDPRPAHPLTPTSKHVRATDAVKRGVAAGGIVVTIVPVLVAAQKGADVDDLLRFDSLRVVTYE